MLSIFRAIMSATIIGTTEELPAYAYIARSDKKSYGVNVYYDTTDSAQSWAITADVMFFSTTASNRDLIIPISASYEDAEEIAGLALQSLSEYFDYGDLLVETKKQLVQYEIPEEKITVLNSGYHVIVKKGHNRIGYLNSEGVFVNAEKDTRPANMSLTQAITLVENLNQDRLLKSLADHDLITRGAHA